MVNGSRTHAEQKNATHEKPSKMIHCLSPRGRLIRSNYTPANGGFKLFPAPPALDLIGHSQDPQAGVIVGTRCSLRRLPRLPEQPLPLHARHAAPQASVGHRRLGSSRRGGHGREDRSVRRKMNLVSWRFGSGVRA